MAQLRFRELPAMVPGKLDVFMADPRLLVIDPDYNCRDMSSVDTVAHVEWLAEQITKYGFKPEMPLTVKRRDTETVVIRGHCRLAGSLLAISRGLELSRIPVMQIDCSDPIDLLFDQEESNNGLRLDEFARGRLCLKARRLGVADEEIARRMHWNQIKSVKDHIELLDTAETLKQDVRSKVMAAGTALQLHREHGEAAPAIAAQAKAAAPTTGKKAGRVTASTVRKVTGKRPQATQDKDNLLDFVAVAGKFADEAKRAGGFDRISTDRLVALAKENAVALAKAKGEKVEEPKAEAHAATEASDPYLEKALADHAEGTTSYVPPADLPSGLPATSETDPAQRQHEDRPAAPQAPRRLNSKVDELLLEFISVERPDLAAMYARLCREHEEAAGEGHATSAQEQLCVAADAIGTLRFPDEWESAKASSELAMVA